MTSQEQAVLQAISGRQDEWAQKLRAEIEGSQPSGVTLAHRAGHYAHPELRGTARQRKAWQKKCGKA